MVLKERLVHANSAADQSIRPCVVRNATESHLAVKTQQPRQRSARTGSPCTSTSRPSASWAPMANPISAAMRSRYASRLHRGNRWTGVGGGAAAGECSERVCGHALAALIQAAGMEAQQRREDGRQLASTPRLLHDVCRHAGRVRPLPCTHPPQPALLEGQAVAADGGGLGEGADGGGGEGGQGHLLGPAAQWGRGQAGRAGKTGFTFQIGEAQLGREFSGRRSTAAGKLSETLPSLEQAVQQPGSCSGPWRSQRDGAPEL